MHIHCLGLNHKTASVALRESLTFTPHQLEAALARLGCGYESVGNSITEMVILSTCNRVEIYAVAYQPVFDQLEKLLSEMHGIPVLEFSSNLYRKLDSEAVTHLLRVAAGLDSMVLGEPQILGQVTDAYSSARRHDTAGKILSRLFQTAIHAGKRTRTETAISENPASIASVAVRLISDTVYELDQAQITVLGAGEMAELAVQALRKRGAKRIFVVNRTLMRAQKLAEQWGGVAATIESLSDLLSQTDVLIASTGAPHTIIKPTMIAPVMESRSDQPMVIMDIAVPRDVDAEVADIAGVRLYDLDALAVGLENSLALRAAEIPRLEAILAEEQEDFFKFIAALDVFPIITEIRQQANSIRQSELEKTIRRMPDLSPIEQQQLEALTIAIVKKILHSPTSRLREAANGPQASEYADIARGLFGLD